jgi:hypothetical protein
VTAPLTPPDCDLRAFRDVPFDIGRFRDSTLVSHEEPEAIVAAILLWGVAWHQVPAASLPDDDKLLARYAGYGRSVDKWLEVREGALRGFVLCSDGRLYHRVLAEKANNSWDQRLRYEHTKAADRHRKAMKNLPDDQQFEFPSFEDWKAGRTVPTKPAKTQGRLDLGEPDFGSPAPSARAPAHGTHGTRTERARTGASSVPSALSNGTDDTFQRNEADIPVENALKGKEGKGKESKSRDSSQPTETVTRVGRLANADLVDLYDAVCEASGFTTSSPDAINRNIAVIERWKHQGFDFEHVVLPTIRRTIANESEPTRTLSRFTKAISHEHARQMAKAANGTVYTSVASPILKPKGEDPQFEPIRLALLESLGAQTYSLVANDIRFEDVGQSGDKRPLRVNGPDHLKEAWTAGRYQSHLKRAAKPLGFTDLWR